MSNYTVLFSEVFLILGVVIGWIASEQFSDYKNKTRHHLEDLFDENPHPEIYNDKGKIHRGDYMVLNFEPGYDPDEFDPEDIYEGP
jgi:hypothetical protein